MVLKVGGVFKVLLTVPSGKYRVKRYLVTGGAGFIGSHLCGLLIGQGDRVRVLDNFSTGKTERLSTILGHQNFELIEGDLRDRETVFAALEGMDGVFHLGAMVSVPHSVENPHLSFQVNAGGTFNVLDGARTRGVPRMVYASSSAVYGNLSCPSFSESAVVRPLSPYGLDKWYGEETARVFHEQYGLETFSLRFFNVYGPGQDPANPYSGVITKFMDCLNNDRQPVIFGDGAQTLDYVHVDDVGRACAIAMEAKVGGFQVFNVGSGASVSVNALLDLLKTIAGSSVTPRHEGARKGDVLHTLGDIRAIRRELGYAPGVELRSGLSGLYEYFKDAPHFP